ncbi:MAG: hypothetical protein PVI23_05565, partial [Maricaulaceae bacterium]
GETIERGGADGFVTRYDADGIEEWTHRLGGIGADAVNAVAVAADGTTYIAGKTTGSLTGNVHGGGSDAFVRAIDADGDTLWTRQFGDSDDEQATALSIADDGDLIVGSVEDGVGYVRKYSSADGVSASLWEHVIGDLDAGAINAIHADATGIYITGAARSGLTLSGALVAHSGARDAFLIALDDGASPSVRFQTFLGSASEDVAADVTVVDGAVFLAGYTDGALPSGSGQLGTRDAFAAKFDATTGALDWTTQITGRSGVSQGAALVVDSAGSSDLDAFGLPTGELIFQDDRAIAQRTTARAGDHFYISVDGGRKIKIAIDADDTLRALTFKINTALVLNGESTVARKDGADALRITPEPGVTLELFAGGEGQDLLAALGLEAGKVTAPPKADEDSDVEEKKSFELRLASDFGVSSFESAKEALSIIETAMAAVRSAYRHITRDRSLDDLAQGPGKRGGQVPAYLLAKISNYQDALARLGGI